MPDVLDRLVGRASAAQQVRHHVRRPVHAYLLVGPPGVDLHEAAAAMAAALQCPDAGCGTCETCRRVLEGVEPDVTVIERAGTTWRVDELREAERVARRRPLGAGYQIVIIEDIELSVAGGATTAATLLKSLEEPPERTIFLLTARDLPAALETIVSRCVVIRWRALSPDSLVGALEAEGADPGVARAAAAAANGDLRRARVLVRDPALAERLEGWRGIPARLRGELSAVLGLVDEIERGLDAAMAPLVAWQTAETERRRADEKAVGARVTPRREAEASQRREQRRFRVEEIAWGLRVLSEVYRDRLVEALEDPAGPRGAARARSSLAALEVVAETHRRLATSMDEVLMLSDLLICLATA